MESLSPLRAETDEFSEEAACAAIALLRREIDDLNERAEALDLLSVMAHLKQASELCSAEVPDFGTN